MISLFHSPGSAEGEPGSWIVFRDLQYILKTGNLMDVPEVVRQADAALNEGLCAAGFLQYEAASALDGSLQTREPDCSPLMQFGIYKSFTTHRSLWEAISGFEEFPGGFPVRRDAGGWTPGLSRERFSRQYAALQEYLVQGESYQVNYTARFTTPLNCPASREEQFNPLGYFLSRIDMKNPGYGGFLYLGDEIVSICSFSPELFFSCRDGILEMEPMKGTRRRGVNDKEDRSLCRELRESSKDRAENLMITDMVRNDAGRIASPRGVSVPELFSIRTLSYAHQMVSRITAQVSDASLERLFSSLFPCASITGAPKVRTMEIIRELEDSPRGVYTGTMGYAVPGGESVSAQFNVAIRTSTIYSDKIVYGAGGGILHESEIDREWEEMHVKLQGANGNRDFALFESILFTELGEFFLEELHINRLIRGIEYFCLDVPMEAVRDHFAVLRNNLVEEQRRSIPLYSSETDSPGKYVPLKVRIFVHGDGSFSHDSSDLGGRKTKNLQLRLAKTPVNPDHPYLRFKTNQREIYTSKMRDDADDVVLFNTRGEITETTSANIVLEQDGVLYTPPVSCGLLGGTYREYLIGQGKLQERIIRVDELVPGTKLLLINSVREWMDGSVLPDEDL